MAEKPFSSPESPRGENRDKSLSEARDIKRDGVKMSQKIAEHIQLPVTGEALYGAIEEIFSTQAIIDNQTKAKEETGDAKDTTGKQGEIDGAREKLLDITERRSAWTRLLEIQKKDPNMPLKVFEEMELKPNNLTLRQIIMDILWLGAQKEEALQKIKKLDSYHLPKTAALYSMIASEVMQEYAEDYFEAGRFDIVKKIFALPEKGIDLAKNKAIAVVEKAKPSLKKYFSDMSPSQQEKMFGRMVKFMSEDKIGQRLVAMSEALPGSSAVKGALDSSKSVVSGMKEGLFSPLCACMMSMMLEGSEDKEKAMIQYVTFLLAGQVIQEGGKWVLNGAKGGLISILEPLVESAEKGSKTRNLLAFLKKGSANKHLVLLASVALVVGAFRIPMVTDFVGDVAKSIDEGWDHGETREVIIGGVSAASYLMQFTSKRFLPAAVGIEVGKIALDGANPFTEQDEFLFKFVTGDGDNLVQTGEQIVGRDPIDAWNARVESAKNGVLTQENNLQKNILDFSKLKDREDWALRSVIPLSIDLSHFDIANAQLQEMLPKLTVSPTATEFVSSSKDIESLRYREYALSGDDIWNTRDGLGNNLLQRDKNSSSGILESAARYNPLVVTARGMDWGDISGRNDKALKWLDDVEGSTEDKLDEFFEGADDLIARETDKCKVSVMVSPAIMTPTGGIPARYELTLDNEKYKKIEPWIKQVKEAKTQWETMRSTADSLAKRVVIGRALGVYDRKQWESEGNPFITPEETGGKETLAFRGLVAQIKRNRQIMDITTPTNTRSAIDIIDAVGSAHRMYGDDILSSDWRKKTDDEYKKWTEKNGFGIDDRHIHTDRVKILVREAYTAGIPQEYIEKALNPVSTMARNQAEGKYVTPDDVRNIEAQLGSLLLDKAFRDKIAKGATLESIGGVEYKCQQYKFSREFFFNRDTVTQVDRVHTTSYRALPGGEFIQTIKSDHEIADVSIPRKRFENSILRIQKEVAAEKDKYQKELQIERAQNQALWELAVEKKNNRLNNETAFQEYYALPSVRENGFEKWEKITSENTPPIVYISRCNRMEEMSNIPQKNVWEWRYPAGVQQVKVAVFWGPGDVAEVTLRNLKELNYSGWDARTKEAVKEALVSEDPEKSLARIVGLIEGHTITETHLVGADTGRVLTNELLTALAPYLDKATDKKAFLRKVIEVLVKNGGVANGAVENIVKEITQ